MRRRGRRADLLVRVGDEDEPLERQAAALRDDRLERVEARQQPGLHVGHAGAVGDAVLDAERALGRGPRIEDRVHVADQEHPRPARPALERGDDRVAEAAGRVRPGLDRGAELAAGRRPPSGRPRRRPPACSSPQSMLTSRLEVGEVGRQVGADRGCAGASSSAADGRGGVTVVASMAAVYVAGTLLSCPDRASGRDPPARRSERLPARAGGQARGRHRPAADLVRPARSRAPRARPPRGRGPGARLARRRSRRIVAWIRRLRIDHGEGRGGLARPSLVGSRATGSSPSRGSARSGR